MKKFIITGTALFSMAGIMYSGIAKACTISNNVGDDPVYICNESSGSVNITRVSSRNRVRTTVNNNATAGGGTIISGEDTVGITIGSGTVTSRVRIIQNIGNILFGTFTPPIFPF